MLTGFNEAFIISNEIKEELLDSDPKSAELIRPILRGRDVKRYGYHFSNLWIIATFPSRNYNIDDFPAIKKHLLSFGMERLEQTGKTYIINGSRIKARKKTNNKWFETQDSISYWDDFSKQKIIWGEISDRPKFAIDISGEYVPEATTFLMTGSYLKYLLCFLNSKLSEYYFSKVGTTTGMGTLRWKKYLILTFPIPLPNEELINRLDTLVDAMLNANGKDPKMYEQRIDEIIYQLLDLTNEEILFIENTIKIDTY